VSKKQKGKTNHVYGEKEFNKPGFSFYPSEKLDWAVVKESDLMSTVVYDGAHKNTNFQDERAGKGKDHAKWVFCEEPGREERIAESPLELLIDAYLEPGASVGQHFHSRTEEVYYILEGAMELTVLNEKNESLSYLLRPGDAHLLKVGQGHYAKAGEQGVRFITVGVRKQG